MTARPGRSATLEKPALRAARSTRRVAAFAILVVLVIAGVVTAAVVAHYRNDRQDAMAQMLRSTEADARLETQLLRDQFSLLEALTATDSVRSGDPARISGLLSRTDANEAGLTGGLAWIDGTGRLRALSNDPEPPPVSFTDRDWFKAAIAGTRFVGEAVPSRVRDGAPAVTLAVPIAAGGGSPGVLVGGFLLDREGAIVTALGDRDPSRMVVDRAGQLIVGRQGDGPTLERAATGSWPRIATVAGPGSDVRAGVTDAAGRADRVVAWKAVPSAGWVTMRSIPAGTLFADARRTLTRSLVVVIALTALVIVLIALAYRMLRRRSDTAASWAERQDALAHAMSLVGAAETPAHVARAVVDAALSALGARAGGISLCDEDATHLVTLHRSGYEAPTPPPWNRYRITPGTPGGAAVLDQAPVFVRDKEAERRFPDASEALRSSGDHAWACAPLRDGPSVLGVVTASFTSPDALTPETELAFELLAERTGVALARARRHEQEHRVAIAFQESLLPGELPTIEGVAVDAVYRPGDSAFGVGGDWYDTVRVDDHRLVIMVGDVVGRGIPAAAAMGQLRATARALAASSGPGALLDAVSAIAEASPATVATSMCCVLVDTASFVIEYAHAGHPPVAALHVDGSVTLLDAPQRPVLGIPAPPSPTKRLALPGIRALVLYSDGLIERHDESLSVCLDRLTTVLADGPLRAAEVMHRCGVDDLTGDDTVVVCVDVTDAASQYHDLFDETRVDPRARSAVTDGRVSGDPEPH